MLLSTEKIITNNYYALEECLSDNPRIPMLSRYTGFGGAKSILHYSIGCSKSDYNNRCTNKSDHQYYEQYQLFEELLLALEKKFDIPATKLLDSIQSNLFTQFYTPSYIPDSIFISLQNNSFQPKTFLDPAAGSGAYIDSFLNFFPIFDKITAIEVDPITSILLKTKYHDYIAEDKMEVLNIPFQDFISKENYDLIATNIPFHNYKIYDKTISAELSKSLHSYYFAKAAQLLSSNGVVSFLAPSGILNNANNDILRKEIAKNFNVINAIQLPNNLYDTTSVNSCLITFSNIVNLKNINEKFALKPLTIELTKDNITAKNSINHVLIDSYENNAIVFNENVSANSHIVSLRPYGKPNYWFVLDEKLQNEIITSKINQDISEAFNNEIALDISIEETINIIQNEFDSNNAIFIKINDKPKAENISATGQLGLFDDFPLSNPALPYINELDKTIVNSLSSKLIFSITINGKEALALVAANPNNESNYLYKFYSNVENYNDLSVNWFVPNIDMIQNDLEHFLSYIKEINNQSSIKYNVNYNLFFSTPKLQSIFNIFEQNGFFKDFLALEIHTKNLDNFLNNVKKVSDNEITNTNFTRRILSIEIPDEFKYENCIFSNNNRLYIVNDKLQPIAFTANNALSFYKDYLNLRQDYFSFKKDNNFDSFNASYDVFVEKYGALNSTFNKRKINNDYFGSEILALETRFGNSFIKSSIFYPKINFEDIKFDDLDTALNASINRFNEFNLAYIVSNSNFTEQEVITYFTSNNLILLDFPEVSWKLSHNVLQGNLTDKIKILDEYKKNNESFLKSYKIEFDSLYNFVISNIPTPIPFNEIGISLGERWIDTSLYSQFFSQLFDDNSIVSYSKDIDNFSITKGSSKIASNDFSVTSNSVRKRLNGYDFAILALKSDYPLFRTSVKNKDGSYDKIIDSNAEIESKNIIKKIQAEFVQFLHSLDAKTKDTLEKKYNYLFNSKANIDTSSVYKNLNFNDIHYNNLDFSELKDHQKKAIYFNLKNNGGINDLEVGLGKTMIMCVSSHEMNRLNINRKNLILCLKANVGEIAHTYSQSYPHDKLLFPNEKDFSKNIEQYLFEIKNNDFDTIIMSHEMFMKIPQNDSIQFDILSNEIEQLNNAILLANDAHSTYELSSKQQFGLETRIKNLEAKKLRCIDRLNEKKINKKITFEDLNIGHIFVDEAHIYKNLSYVSIHDRVKGLSPQSGSERANNLLVAIRTLQQNNDSDFCATFLTGTPLSNSIVEMYSLFSYLNPSELQNKGLTHFDAFAASFCTKSVDYEYTIASGYNSVERFREFNKIPDLAKWYHEITNYCDAEMTKIDRPDKIQEFLTITPNDEQLLYFNYIKEFATDGEIKDLNIKAQNDKSLMIEAMTMARLLSVDSRLMDAKAIDNPNSKVNKCIAEVVKTYNDTTDFLGTQIIFSDLGTPGNQRFNLYDDIRQKLIQYGVKDNEIAFIHDATTDAKKAELFFQMNNGDIRVLLGSSSKAGTGLNVQKLLVRVHHLDIPWTPRHLEQRDGRGQRTGNIACKNYLDNKFTSTIYGVEKSPDIILYNTVLRKQNFIKQVRSNSIHERVFDMGTVDDNSMSQQEFIAQLSGNNQFLEKAILERNINELQVLKSNFFKKINKSIQLVDFYNREIINLSKNIPILENALGYISVQKKDIEDNISANVLKDKKFNPLVLYPLSLNNFIVKEDTLISHFGKHIKDNFLTTSFIEAQDKNIGSIYSFPIFVNHQAVFIQIDDFKINVFKINPLELHSFSDVKIAKEFDAVINNIDFQLRCNVKDLKRYKEELPSHIDISSRTIFEHQGKLDDLQIQLNNLLDDIKSKTSNQDQNIHKQVVINNSKEVKMNKKNFRL